MRPGASAREVDVPAAASARRSGADRPDPARDTAVAEPSPGPDRDEPTRQDRPARRRRRWPRRTVLVALGGLTLLLAFPGYDRPGLAVLGPAALALAVHRQRLRSGLWLGLVFGAAFFVPLLSWTGVYVGPLPWLALAAWETLHLAVLGGATALTSRLPWWPLWSAALWVADEAVRGRFLLGGFPWGRLGLSQTGGPFLSLAAYGGVPLVTFAVALTGALLAAAVLALRSAWTDARADDAGAGDAASRVAIRPAVLALAGALVIPLLGALAWLPLPGPSLTDGGPTRTVAVVQGNVPRAGLDFNAQRRAVLDDHVQQTLQLAQEVSAGSQPKPDLVVWPENSSDIDPYANPDAAGVIDRAARAIGAPILVGAVVDGPGRYISNTAIVWDPQRGPGQTYVKRHPVPLAEYVPARAFFHFFSPLIDRVHDQKAGDRPGLLSLGGAQVGDVICFEVAYDPLVRDVVRAGAGMIVVQTNNATFGFTDESAQQLAISRVRAVESGRTVVVAATSGLSAVVAPDGSVVESSTLFTPDVFVERVAQRSSATLATRLGEAPEWALTALGAAGLAGAVLWPRRVRRPAAPVGETVGS
jgi:apolipoprotein N-acyltransferase